MNAESSAHEIPKVPNVFVDAFRGKYLAKTRRLENTFILTHYHGDHYGSLPRDEKYTGPAKIHCTPITATLLRRIHRVPDTFIVEHPYGESWTVMANGTGGVSTTVKVTFYDANHCPGAAIVTFELHDESVHVHTGDFRFHESMQSYPILRDAAMSQRIDTILLDTTYGHPKHNFEAQDNIVESIASQISQELDGKTLILLECYNIGKEKILWATANACEQLIHVSHRKWDLLECLSNETVDPAHCQIISKCTLDPVLTDIHVVPMSTAGEMWPFFQPNYDSVVEYATKQSKKYSKVVAFVPTGWAGASNWNKKHASTMTNRNGIDVEIRLAGYSEHSSFAELQKFIQFAKPLKVVATVYKDANDKRRIEARFPVDRNRAKKRFLGQLAQKHRFDSAISQARPSIRQKQRETDSIHIDDSEDDKLLQLLSMGFSRASAVHALESCRQNVETAINLLLQGKQSEVATPSHGKPQAAVTPASVKSKSTKMTDFFVREDKQAK
jgi:DNA cross-link repair 1A protein